MSPDKNLSLHEEEEDEEDYIDMELSSKNSSPQTKEFEFQMFLTPNDKETNNTFPADNLFYKGKLLPLLLPSRRQMVRNLAAASFDFTKMPLEQDHNYHSIPSTNTLNTPLDSCNISTSESCRVSCELNPDDDYFFEWSTELSSLVSNNNNHLSRKKLPWSKKVKLGNKLKASRAYLRSLFIKPACSDESSAKANCNSVRNSEEIANEYLKINAKKKKPTIATIMKSMDYKDGIEDDDNNNNNNNNNFHRRSFSSAIKRHYPAKCLSSSSSGSNGFHELRRSSSATEIEGSIEAAIAHCKKSYQVFDSRNSSTEPENCSFSVSRDIADQKRSGFCSI